MPDITFRVTGSFSLETAIKSKVERIPGEISQYTLPDGRRVSLMVTLEVENPEDNSYTYVTNQSDMDALGFTCLDYDETTFFEDGD